MADWVLSSSALVLLTLLLRVLLKSRLDPRLRYALWLLALLRLLCPLPLFHSALSLPGLAEQAVQSRTVLSPGESIHENAPAGEALPALPEAAESAGQVTSPDGSFPWRAVLWGLYISGAAGLLLAALIANRKLGRQLRQGARPLPGQWTVPPRQIYISPCPAAPCLFGLRRPAIYVPEALAVDDRALGHVLAHERAHYRHLDPLWALLRLLALALHWYDPLVWWACFLSRQDAEAAADATAIGALGEKERLDYGRTLLALVAGPAGLRSALDLGTSMSASRRSLRDRVRLIARRPKTALPALLLVLLCGALAFRLGYAGPVEEEATPAPAPVSTPPVASPAAPAADSGAVPAQKPLPSLYYGGKLYYLSYTDSVLSGPLCSAREDFGLLTAPAGAEPRADLEVSDSRLAGLTLRRYSNAALPHGLCVELDGELLVFAAYEDMDEHERRRADILSDEESFTGWLRQDMEDWDSALSEADYAAAYELPLISLPEGSGFQSLGPVWLRQDPGGTGALFLCRVFYNYSLGAAVYVYQDDLRPNGFENFYTSRTNESGQYFSETHPWAWFSAGYTPVTESGSVRLLLFSALPLDEDFCFRLLTGASA